jgi:hypothetical protein
MFRKLALALVAAAALGTAGLTPTSADAGWKFKHWHGHHHFWGHRHFGFYPVYAGCVRWVPTPYGFRRVNVCHYY